nr:Gfo/Idh/MocA family oxidoreductase [Nocardioides thalensis]
MVGLGTIARTHAAVITRLDRLRLVGAVDPAPGFAVEAPAHRTLHEALDAGTDPDVVVLATPTDTHVGLVDEVLRTCDATVLCEKPLAATVDEIDGLELRHGAVVLTERVRVAHHFAFSPEVEWARRTAEQHPEWGPPTRVLCVSHDPYGHIEDDRAASLVSSWVDSGPNQLSVAAAFAGGWEVVSHVAETGRSVSVLDHAGGRTTLVTNWLAGDSSKQSEIEYGAGGVRIRIDHTSMTALVLRDGEVAEQLTYAGADSRKVEHYLGVYRALLDDPDDHRLGVPLARTIASLLEGRAPIG